MWWWDWEVLGVVVEGAVGDVGFGGVPHVFCETQGRGRTGACRWMRCAPGPDRGHKDRSRPWGGGTWRCPGPLRTSSPHRSRAPGDPFMRVICSAFWFHGVDLPAFFQQIVGLAPDLGHPLGDGLLVAAPYERVGAQRLMPDKRMSSQYEDSDLYSTPNLIRRDILKVPGRPRNRLRRPPPMAVYQESPPAPPSAPA